MILAYFYEKSSNGVKYREMQPFIDHSITTSFVEYLNYKILTRGTAFANTNVTFYPSSGQVASGYAIYASPYKGFVADVGATGAIIPSGISGVGGFIVRGTSGCSIDWNNGRVIFSGAANNLTNLSGRFAIKDFNILYSPKDEESLLFDTKFVLNNPTVPQTLTGLAENQITYPAIIVKYYPGNNKPFCFGGTEESQSEFRCIVVSDNQFKLDGACGIIRDLARSYFGLLAPHETPFNYLGDIKSGNTYNYTGLAYVKSGENIVMINDVFISPLNAKIAADINPNAKIAFCDLQIRPVRNTRG